MHLTDDELLFNDGDTLNHDLSEHLDRCQSCQSRLDVLVRLRAQFSELPELVMPNDRWQAIMQANELKDANQALSRSKSHTRFWQVTSLALAASFVGVLIAMLFITDNSLFPGATLEQQVANLIEENNQLQQTLKIQEEVKNSTLASVRWYELELSAIDKELQVAYLQGSSLENKIKLWSTRKSLIKEIINELSRKQSKARVFI